VEKTPKGKKNIDRSNGTLKVGTNAEFPPYEYYEDNKVTGIDTVKPAAPTSTLPDDTAAMIASNCISSTCISMPSSSA